MSGSSFEPSELPAVPFDDEPRPVPARPASLPAFRRWDEWRHDPRLFTAGLLLTVLAAGGWWVRLSVTEPSGALAKPAARSGSSAPTVNRQSSGAATNTTTTTVGVFVVDVVGAVRHPGVVSLPGTARVIDAVTAAGGALAAADLDRINLAAHLVDGMRIAVPRRGTPADPAAPTNDPGASGASGASGATGTGGGGAPTPSAPLDLNTATEVQLEALPGIGPSLAQAIIQEREHEGGFHTVDDLRRVRGIGDVRFAQLRPLVSV
jgi:competence protein ComEA